MQAKPKRQRIESGRTIQGSAVKVEFTPSSDQSVLQDQLQRLAGEIVSGLSALEPSQSKELLGNFVSALFLSVAEESRREDRKQRQAEGIAAAKKRGVRFGPQPKPLPDNFNEYYEAWQDGLITLTQAAEACGLSRQAFYRAIARIKQNASCAV